MTGVMMNAIIYTQAEADFMINVKKYIEYDAWAASKNQRRGTDEISRPVQCEPVVVGGKTYTFTIQRAWHELTESFSITLMGSIDRLPSEGLCRFEIQDGPHFNPKWYKPKEIPAGEPHRHCYNEEAVKRFNEWSACADLLNCAKSRDAIVGEFFKYVNLHATDKGTHRGLFEGEV